MINFPEIIRQLTANAEIIRAMVQTVSTEQATWKPKPDAWCMREVMEHVYNEERVDFRTHLQEMLSVPSQPWGSIHAEWITGKECGQSLVDFLKERETSLAWLKTLSAPNWEVKTEMKFGPAGEAMVLSAGDVLVSWVAHDYLHVRQITELLYAWNEKQVSPNSVQYAGGW